MMKRVVRAVCRASWRKFRAAFAAVVFFVNCGAAFAQSWTYSNGILTGEDGMKLTATLSKGEVSVTGISYRGALTTIDLRGTVTGPNGEDYTIVSAAGLSFSGLKELYLPDTLRYLGSFDGCTSLEKVEPLLPPAMTSFAGQLFRSCSKLTGDIKISNPNFTTMARCAFQGTKVTSVDFTGSGISYLADWVFTSCTSLTNVTPFLPDSIYFIDTSAFSGCTKLKKDLKLNNANLTKIPNNAFNGDPITSVDFGCCPIEIIGSGAFGSCTSLTNMTPFLPSTVKSVGEAGTPYTFRYVPIRKELKLNCPNLKHIYHGTFQGMGITSLDLTGCGVTNFGAYAFDSCSYLTNVTCFLPDCVQFVGQSAFNACHITNSLVMTGRLPIKIDASAFKGNPMGDVNLRDACVTELGSEVFRDSPVKKVMLPPSLATIGNGCFRGANGKGGFWFCGPKPAFGSGNTAFYLGCQALTTAYFFPMGDQSWIDYINSENCSLVDLTAAERKAFKTLFPNFKHMPKQKVQMQKNGPYEYVCFWHPIPPGLKLLVR